MKFAHGFCAGVLLSAVAVLVALAVTLGEEDPQAGDDREGWVAPSAR